MMDFESFFVSSTLKKRLLNNSKATIDHAGIHEFPLNDLLDHHSQEIIASEFLQCLASREHAQNKKGKRKHRFSVSIVQSTYFFDEMEGFQVEKGEGNPTNNVPLSKVIADGVNLFYNKIFIHPEKGWLEKSTGLSAFIILHESPSPGTSQDPKVYFPKIRILGCLAYFSTDNNIFLNCLAVNSFDKPKVFIPRAQTISLPARKQKDVIQSKAMDISTSKMLSFSNTGIGVFLLSFCQAFAKRVNLFDKKLIPLANVPSHLDVWAQVEDKLGSVRQFYNRNGFYSVYQDEFTQEELDIAE